MLSDTGNAVVSLWTGHAVVPYATGGVGGLTMFERPGVGVFNDEPPSVRTILPTVPVYLESSRRLGMW